MKEMFVSYVVESVFEHTSVDYRPAEFCNAFIEIGKKGQDMKTLLRTAKEKLTTEHEQERGEEVDVVILYYKFI